VTDANVESVPVPVDLEADQSRASVIALSASDLPEWTQSGAEPSLGVLGECAGEFVGSDLGVLAQGPELWNPNEVSASSVGVVFALISDASAVFGELNGEVFQECVLAALPGSLEEGLQLSGVSVSPASPPVLGEATGGMRFVVALASDAEPALPSRFYEFLWVLNGREIAGLLLAGEGKVPPAAVESDLFGTLAGKVGAAPNEPAAADTATTETQTQADSPDEATAAVAADLEAVVQAWYAQADPAVCTRMTDAMLDFGWGEIGDLGRQECQRSLETAAPVEDVVITATDVRERRATVDVSYAVDGGSNVDRVTFILRGGQWLINRVRLVGLELASSAPDRSIRSTYVVCRLPSGP
jgi:hypothetical protein